MELEKEVRYLIANRTKQKVIEITTPYKARIEMLDITCGYAGFDSYGKYGYICRVRQKGDKITLEVKNYMNEKECIEQAIKLDNVKDGINYLKLIGMEPYLYLKRFREVRKYKNLKVFIDEFDILGTYIEIEYQDSNEKELDEFVKLLAIKGEPQDMYGGIVKNKLANDENFRKLFQINLTKIIEEDKQ